MSLFIHLAYSYFNCLIPRSKMFLEKLFPIFFKILSQAASVKFLIPSIGIFSM